MSNLDRQALLKKWAPILEHDAVAPIKDQYRKEVTAVLLENQEREMGRQTEALFETVHANNIGAGADTGAVAKYDPVLISLVRRAAPMMIAYDICGVQPMTQPTGLIFAMKSRYATQGGTEALFNEADTDFSGNTDSGATAHSGAYDFGGSETTGTGLATADGERLGQGGTGS
jgi:hypothetical protein